MISSILLNLFTHEDLLYRKLNNSEHPPVCKKFTSMEYLSPVLVKVKTPLIFDQEECRGGSWTINVNETLQSTKIRLLQGSSRSISNCNFSRPQIIHAT